MALARKLCSGSFSRTLARAGCARNGGERALSSALAESYYNDEQKEMMATTKKLIEAEINPVQYGSVKRKDTKCVKIANNVTTARGKVGVGADVAGPRGPQEAGQRGAARRQQARGVRRSGARLEVQLGRLRYILRL